MRLLIVNPNSSPAMSDLIAETVESLGATATVVNPESGPAAIETDADEAAAVAACLAMLDQSPQLLAEADAVLIACYGDPGLQDIAAIADVPVFGIAQLSMAAASAVNERFGLIVAKPSAIDIMSRLATGYNHHLDAADIAASGASVLSMLHTPEEAYPQVLAAAQELKARGVNVVCLGCASMGRFAARLREDAGIIALDAVTVSVGLLRNAVA